MVLLVFWEVLRVFKAFEDLEELFAAPAAVPDLAQSAVPDTEFGDYAAEDVAGEADARVADESEVLLHAGQTPSSRGEAEAELEQGRVKTKVSRTEAGEDHIQGP